MKMPADNGQRRGRLEAVVGRSPGLRSVRELWTVAHRALPDAAGCCGVLADGSAPRRAEF